MRNKTNTNSEPHSSLLLTVPQYLVEDLHKLAEHNGTTIEELVFSYIVEGLAGDSQLVKRLNFSDQVADNLGEKGFLDKSPGEIINEFNILC